MYMCIQFTLFNMHANVRVCEHACVCPIILFKNGLIYRILKTVGRATITFAGDCQIVVLMIRQLLLHSNSLNIKQRILFNDGLS